MHTSNHNSHFPNYIPHLLPKHPRTWRRYCVYVEAVCKTTPKSVQRSRGFDRWCRRPPPPPACSIPFPHLHSIVAPEHVHVVAVFAPAGARPDRWDFPRSVDLFPQRSVWHRHRYPPTTHPLSRPSNRTTGRGIVHSNENERGDRETRGPGTNGKGSNKKSAVLDNE